MVIIADLAAFCSDLVTPCFVDSSCLLCYTRGVIANNDHACFMRPEQAFYKLLYNGNYSENKPGGGSCLADCFM